MARPLIVIDPQPRGLDEIFEPTVRARLESLGELAIHDGAGRMPAERFESYLPEMTRADRPERHAEGAGSTARRTCAPSSMSRPISSRTSTTRPASNAESMCSRRVPPSPGRSPRWRSGMAIDLCRGVTAADRAMRSGKREMAARRRGRVLLALWRAGRPDRLRRSRARLHSAACAVRLPDQGLRSVDFRSFHGRLRRRRRVARRGVGDEPGHRRVRRA